MSFLRQSCNVLVGKLNTPSSVRPFHNSNIRLKALENWKRPSIDELITPKEPWRHVHERNQKRYNAQLLVGASVFGATVFVASTIMEMNPAPVALIKKIKYSTVLPVLEKAEASISEEETELVEEEVIVAVAAGEVAAEVVQEEVVAEVVQEEAPAAPLPTLEALPEEVPYLLVGAGTASFAAFRAIKSRDPTAKILIIGDEPRLPYMRPPLSKELWFVADEAAKQELKFKSWNGKERSLLYEPTAFYTPVSELEEAKNGGISVVTGRRVVRIDTAKQVAHLSDGAKIKYGKCLLATGGAPKTLPVLEGLPSELSEKITLFRKVEDFMNLDKIVDKSKSITILGGGFLGSELACALGQRAKFGLVEVNQAYQEKGNMAKVLPEYLSDWTTDKVKSEGVNVIPNSRIKGVKLQENGRLKVDLSGGNALETDHVVVAVGVQPDHKLAAESDIMVDTKHGGYVVNDQFEASHNLWVAGDAASFMDPLLGRRRVEHHDHAVVSGRLAGENMTGAGKNYTHQSMFWSDLGPDVGYEAIGIVDSKLPTVGVFAKATEIDTPKATVTKSGEADRSVSEAKVKSEVPAAAAVVEQQEGEDYGKGVIFYLKENKIVGVLLWNVFNRMNIARRVLKEGKSYDDLTEVAKLFNIHAAE